VVEPAVADRYEEMIRLNRALKGLVSWGVARVG